MSDAVVIELRKEYPIINLDLMKNNEQMYDMANSIDYDKYIKYEKYQKRVLNRKKLFAKRKAKYGR